MNVYVYFKKYYNVIQKYITPMGNRTHVARVTGYLSPELSLFKNSLLNVEL